MTAQMAKDNKHTYFLLFPLSAAAGRPSAGRVPLLPVVGEHVSACSAQTGTFHVPACFLSMLERLWRKRLLVTVEKVWAGRVSQLLDKQHLVSASVSQRRSAGSLSSHARLFQHTQQMPGQDFPLHLHGR